MGFKWPEGMKEVHYLDRLEGKKAIFKDGTEQDADAIILCTGYLHHFPFLDESIKLKTHNRLYPPKLYKGVVWQDNHKLMYLDTLVCDYLAKQLLCIISVDIICCVFLT